jgi:hypothetical protein
MNSMNMLKVTVAFLAGLVIALGGALIYVRSNEPSRVAQVTSAAVPAQTAPAPATTEPAAAPTTPTVAPPTAAEPAKTAETEPPPPVREHKSVQKKEVARTVKPKPRKVVNDDDEAATAPAPPPQGAPAPESVQTAQATPPPQQNMQPEPAAAPAPPPPPPPQVVTLQPGTTLKVRTLDTISTDHNFTGDTFRATLESPIVRNGYIIADRGSQVLGRVVNSEKAGRVQGLADLTLALTAINTTDGQRISIQTNTTNIKGAASKKRDAAEIAGGSALGAIIGAIAGGGKGAAIGAGAGGGAGTVGALSTRGKAAVIQAETPLTFQLNAPATITEKMNQ